MVLLLHGCQQRSTEFARQSGFTTAADAGGFILITPRQEIQHQIQRCWQWYDSSHQRRDAGEPAILRGIVDEALAETVDWRIDPRRIYTAGLSAGGAMALILATTYPDVFAAAGVHSATAYRSATQGFRALGAMAARGSVPSHHAILRRMAPVVLIHGTDDRVVRPPNADRIVDQWLASRDAGRPQGLNRIRPLATTRAFVGGRPPLHQDALVHRPRAPRAGVLADRRPWSRLVRRAGEGQVHRSSRPAVGRGDVDVLPPPSPSGPWTRIAGLRTGSGPGLGRGVRQHAGPIAGGGLRDRPGRLPAAYRPHRPPTGRLPAAYRPPTGRRTASGRAGSTPAVSLLRHRLSRH